MTEETDPVRALISARDKLVEERRALAVAMALGYRRRRTDDGHSNNEMRETFIDIQQMIEAVDRAIKHENAIKSEDPAVCPDQPTVYSDQPTVYSDQPAVCQDQPEAYPDQIEGDRSAA